jgi:hypothetical protein
MEHTTINLHKTLVNLVYNDPLALESANREYWDVQYRINWFHVRQIKALYRKHFLRPILERHLQLENYEKVHKN